MTGYIILRVKKSTELAQLRADINLPLFAVPDLTGYKMIIRKLCIFACLTLITGGLFAHDMWTGIKKIESVQVLNEGGFMINFDTEINVDCSHGGTSTLLISPNENGVTRAGARSLLSTALIAFSTGSDVNIMYSNDTSFCWGKYLLISK